VTGRTTVPIFSGRVGINPVKRAVVSRAATRHAGAIPSADNHNVGWNVRSKRERPNDSNQSPERFSFFHPALNGLWRVVTCLICPTVATPAQMSARFGRCSVEPRFGIRFVSSCGYGTETHQSRQIRAAD
jgi:hypothetical protein